MNDRSCSPCGGETAVASSSPARATFRPRIDLLSNAEGEVLRAELPGVKRENLEIRVDGEHLVVRGTVEDEPQGRSYLLREYAAGDFERRFRIGADLDTAGIAAEWADGVLTLRLPRKAEAKPRRIEVSAARM